MRHCYDTALFWADKICVLEKDSIKDLYTFIHCLFCCGQYQRALNIIKDRDLNQKNILFRYVAAKCHVACKEYEQALEILNWEGDNLGLKVLINNLENAVSFTLNGRNIKAALNLLRGQIHEALGCSDAAVECYKSALHCDVFCYEALHALTSNQMLTTNGENHLIQNLPIYEQCDPKQAKILEYIYSTKISKPDKQLSFFESAFEQNSECGKYLKDNLDIMINRAERLYFEGDYESSYNICRKVLDKDQFHKTCIPLYVSSLVHLNKVTRLMTAFFKVLLEKISNQFQSFLKAIISNLDFSLSVSF
ncbi:cell division cycle 16 -like protein [Brachionus plicatilis]|uniref:Cell division cycle 16-like protein n=1 Tax=Brachionus plicatilis TaxID=10195 RepID=A0A3M7Q3F6_BRAPC|nr:cell division cycle 16 -like protein [Brachionus plicatilis]